MSFFQSVSLPIFKPKKSKQKDNLSYKLSIEQFNILCGYKIYPTYIEKLGINLLHVESNRLHDEENKYMVILVFFTKNDTLYHSRLAINLNLFEFYNFMLNQKCIIHHFIIFEK